MSLKGVVTLTVMNNKYLSEYIRLMKCLELSDDEKKALAAKTALRAELRKKEQKKQVMTAASVAVIAAAVSIPLFIRSGWKFK